MILFNQEVVENKFKANMKQVENNQNSPHRTTLRNSADKTLPYDMFW
jgi:tRNA A22 N-methylase